MYTTATKYSYSSAWYVKNESRNGKEEYFSYVFLTISGRCLHTIPPTERTLTMLATSAAAKFLARRNLAPALGAARAFNLEAYEGYGKSVFAGNVADEYLKKHGASGDLLKDPSWTKTHADTVAKAVLDW